MGRKYHVSNERLEHGKNSYIVDGKIVGFSPIQARRKRRRRFKQDKLSTVKRPWWILHVRLLYNSWDCHGCCSLVSFCGYQVIPITKYPAEEADPSKRRHVNVFIFKWQVWEIDLGRPWRERTVWRRSGHCTCPGLPQPHLHPADMGLLTFTIVWIKEASVFIGKRTCFCENQVKKMIKISVFYNCLIIN